MWIIEENTFFEVKGEHIMKSLYSDQTHFYLAVNSPLFFTGNYNNVYSYQALSLLPLKGPGHKANLVPCTLCFN